MNHGILRGHRRRQTKELVSDPFYPVYPVDYDDGGFGEGAVDGGVELRAELLFCCWVWRERGSEVEMVESRMGKKERTFVGFGTV